MLNRIFSPHDFSRDLRIEWGEGGGKEEKASRRKGMREEKKNQNNQKWQTNTRCCIGLNRFIFKMLASVQLRRPIWSL